MPIKVTRSSNDYLEHHGILGQKWGKRNGPPYPLKAEDHSPSEEKAGWEKSVSKATNVYEKARKIKKAVDESIERNNPNPKHSEEEKLSKRKPWDEKPDTEFKGTNITNKTWSKRARTAMLAAGGAVVGLYAVKKISDLDLDDADLASDLMTLSLIGSLAAAGLIESKISSNEKHTELTDYKNDEQKNKQILDSYKKLNEKEDPVISMTKTNPRDGELNCMYCTTAMEMRQRGYDVTASVEKGNGLTFDGYKKAWPNAKNDIAPMAEKAYREDATDDDYIRYMDYCRQNLITESSITKTLTDLYGDNARGNLMVSNAIFGTGHSVYFTITDGKVDIYDGQTSEHYNLKNSILTRAYAYTSSIRFDDSEPNMQMLEPLLKRK